MKLRQLFCWPRHSSLTVCPRCSLPVRLVCPVRRTHLSCLPFQISSRTFSPLARTSRPSTGWERPRWRLRRTLDCPSPGLWSTPWRWDCSRYSRELIGSPGTRSPFSQKLVSWATVSSPASPWQTRRSESFPPPLCPPSTWTQPTWPWESSPLEPSAPWCTPTSPTPPCPPTSPQPSEGTTWWWRPLTSWGWRRE